MNVIPERTDHPGHTGLNHLHTVLLQVCLCLRVSTIVFRIRVLCCSLLSISLAPTILLARSGMLLWEQRSAHALFLRALSSTHGPIGRTTELRGIPRATSRHSFHGDDSSVSRCRCNSVAWPLCLLVSWSFYLLVPWALGFLVSWYLSLLVSGVLPP